MTTNLRIALRSLAKSPGFSAVAILTLALGIGLSTSSFSIANVLLLRNLSYPESENLVRIFRTSPKSDSQAHSPGNLLDLRDGATTLSDITFTTIDQHSFAEPGQPARTVWMLVASSNFFDAIRLQPALGRGFSPDDGKPGRESVVVLSNKMWKRNYGSDPGVLGRKVRINGEECTIVGVMPASFHAPLLWGPAEVIRPMAFLPEFSNYRSGKWLDCFARIKPGTTRKQVSSELALIAERLAKAYPKENEGEGLRIAQLATSRTDNASRAISFLLMGLALLVLFIACANLAGLLIAKSVGRTRELAVRTALGASRWQLMKPLLLESLLLSLAGGALGVVAAAWSNSILGSYMSINGEQGLDIPLDGRVLAFAAVTSLITGLAFGLAPALLSSRASANNALKDGARGSTGGKTHNRMKGVLIVGEIAMALVVVGMTASFAIATKNLLKRPLGWQPQGIFQGVVNLPAPVYDTTEKCREFSRAFLEKVRALPGVEAVCLGNATPFYSYYQSMGVVAEGQPVPSKGQEPLALKNPVSADYFATLRIPLLKGSLFAENVQPKGEQVVIVNESLAKRLWPDRDPVGRRLRDFEKDSWLKVVGVVGDVRMALGVNAPPSPYQLYRPLAQESTSYLTFAIRVKGVPPGSVAKPVQGIISGLDQDLPMMQAGELSALVDNALSNLNLVMVDLGIFAVLGLVIAAMGIYGIISHITALRTRDIGVRIALGAQRSTILLMVLRQGTLLMGLGLGAGLLLTYLANLLLAKTMPEFGLPRFWLQCPAALVIGLVTLLACYLPARRAAKIDPMEALRAD